MERTGSKHIDQLVLAAMNGDGTAFTMLWDTYIDMLRNFIRSIMNVPDDFFVDDVCSRSFEKAFRQIKTFDPSRSQFFTWLRVIARNTALDIRDQESRLHPKEQIVYLDDDSVSSSAVESIPDQIATPLDSIIKEESDERNVNYVMNLPELYRDIARMRLIDGMQYKEIAAALDMPLNTVRTRINRANRLLMQMSREGGIE